MTITTSELPYLHGRFEALRYETFGEGQGRLVLVGWMFRPGLALKDLHVTFDDRPLGHATPMRRDDVAAAYQGIDVPTEAGFFFEHPLLEEDVQGLHRLEILGYVDGQPIGRMATAFTKDFAAQLPTPPEELMVRVTRERNPMTYLCSGLELLEALRSAFHRHAHSLGRVLDWGCGTGRLSALLLTHCQPDELAGCDLVSDSIAWCTEQWPEATFRTSELYPPLPWPDGHFNTVVGNSVFTHLERDTQTRWLQELHRILRPGGRAFVTVHGEFAAAHSQHGSLESALAAADILDHYPDDILDDVIPTGYYRAVFQTETHTRRKFSRFFEVEEYRSGGMGHYQDLVVLRRL